MIAEETTLYALTVCFFNCSVDVENLTGHFRGNCTQRKIRIQYRIEGTQQLGAMTVSCEAH